MKITKVSHSCILVEKDGTGILVDPGGWSPEASEYLDRTTHILITHQHQDHLHPEFLTRAQKPVFCNKEVATLIPDIHTTTLVDGESMQIGAMSAKPYTSDHLPIHPDVPVVQNTGVLFDEKFYHPGDAFFVPDEEIELLAFPVVAPFLKISESLAYAEEVDTKKVFPIHDGMLNQERLGPFYRIPSRVLGDSFTPLTNGKSLEI